MTRFAAHPHVLDARSIPDTFSIPYYASLIEPRNQHERLNLRYLLWPPEGYNSV